MNGVLNSFFKFLMRLFFIASLSTQTLADVTHSISPNSIIKIGKTVSATGHNALIGLGMILGTNIYLAKINAQGGINGQKIESISMNDGYEPLPAAKNVRQLIEKDHVLALVGNNGTPTTAVVVPIIVQNKVLLYGTYSGASFLRKLPPNHYIFTFRAGFDGELAETVKGLLEMGVKLNEVVFFIQNDAYGEEVYDAAMRAFKTAGFAHPETLPVGMFPRNTTNVEDALTEILIHIKAPPKVIIMAGDSQSNAKFIKLAHKKFPNTYFIVGTAQISEQDLTKEEQDKTLATQVVPSPSSNLPAAKEYQADLKQYGQGGKSSFVSFESYLGTKLFVMAVQKAIAENKLNREGIIDVLESMHDVDIGIDEKINFSKMNHQALHRIWPLRIVNGKFVPFNWNEIKIKIK